MKLRVLFCTIFFFTFLLIALMKIEDWIENYRSKKYRVIDKNGSVANAKIYSKSTYKGKWLKFTYYFNGKLYSNEMQNDSLFNSYAIGDMVEAVVDTLHPHNAYLKYLRNN